MESEDVENVERALQGLLDRTNEMISRRLINPADTSLKTEAAALKNEIKALNKWGTIDGQKRDRTECEQIYFYYPIWRSVSALSLLLASANPSTSKWLSSWQDVRNLFQEYLDRLRNECPPSAQHKFQ